MKDLGGISPRMLVTLISRVVVIHRSAPTRTLILTRIRTHLPILHIHIPRIRIWVLVAFLAWLLRLNLSIRHPTHNCVMWDIAMGPCTPRWKVNSLRVPVGVGHQGTRSLVPRDGKGSESVDGRCFIVTLIILFILAALTSLG